MKIVQVEDFFHPDAGYQLNVLSKYLTKFGHEVTIIAAEMEDIPSYLKEFFGAEDLNEKDRQYEKNNNVKIIRLPIRSYISGRAIFNTNILINSIKKEKPDVLYVHGNDTYTAMNCFWNIRKLGCPIISDTHMVALASKNKFRSAFRVFYRVAVSPIIKKNHITVIKTVDDPYVNHYFGVPEKQTPLVSFGSDTLLFHPDAEKKEIVRKMLEIGQDAFVVVYAGKLDQYKGGLFLGELAKQKINTNKKLVYLIIGNVVGDYGKSVECSFEESPNRIIRLPTQKYSDLAQFFQASDLAIIPKQCSLSIYDMQACGLPVLAEDNNINKERLSKNNGMVFRSGDCTDCVSKLETLINMNSQDYAIMSQNAYEYVLENYDYEKKTREYEKYIIAAMLNNSKS